MARTKQKRLIKVKELPNVFSYKTPNLKESLQSYFVSSNRFTLEIGCGHGDYSIELAKKYPDRYFIGIDVKGARIFNGAIKALELELKNAAFIITKAEVLNQIFQDGSVDEIYIPFPDPHYRRSNEKRRLISSQFINMYSKLLSENGLIHFKTDNQALFEYVLKSISDSKCKIVSQSEDLNKSENSSINSDIVTTFENHYIKQKRKIKYLCFKF